MQILAMGTSNNSYSINRTLAVYAAGLVRSASIDVVNIDDYELPVFSERREKELGNPLLARRFHRRLGEADALVVSFAEHNGNYTAAYKNLMDWVSRIDKRIYQDKSAVFLSASPGPGGAASVLASAVESAGYFGARLVASLSIPSFTENFDEQRGIMTNPVIRQNLLAAMQQLHREFVENLTREAADGFR